MDMHYALRIASPVLLVVPMNILQTGQRISFRSPILFPTNVHHIDPAVNDWDDSPI